MMNYNLNSLPASDLKNSTWVGLKSLLKLVEQEKKKIVLAVCAILLNSSLNLLGPYLIGHTIDKYIQTRQYHGVLVFAGILFTMYIVAFVSSYFQTNLMGGVGQRIIFELRNSIFNKIQQLPVAFFNENKAGDLISRVNNDTDKLSQFFSQSLMQFIGSIVTMIGAGIFLLVINFELGLATLVPALLILIFTRGISPWVKHKNALNLKSTGGMSAEIQESLNNFKVIIAFNRRDYFKKRFDTANRENYRTAIAAGLANNMFMPVFGLFSSIAQLTVLSFGIYLIIQGHFSIGLLVSYLSYATNFYNPLRQLASLWTSFQVALAGWDRISQILSLSSNLVTVFDHSTEEKSAALLEFRNVHFGYQGGFEILHNISFSMEQGKTYALVGPTGGGKTTTASIMARLYDPLEGTVLLRGRDIRSYTDEERAEKIGFILQEPFLFTGTVRENILYSNSRYHKFTNEQFLKVLLDSKLEGLLATFDQGLETAVLSGGDSLSIGQKQLIAFMRAVLRKPELLILDEATANIDTVTEKLLGQILDNLPKETTLVVIAHRLNTIENADEIYFINSGEVSLAGSFKEAVDKLMSGKRVS
ncbi:ATP-binding cassette, subfamily B [Pedobacter westerhofensis]|uniref:ATP-binding cassette, subfamily B n=1 Tax=Pedobacter westerhofensis TaxID=425512 RepID=A0A521AIQ3_9SPHI|nr:ABC transporter ATP-binding protein [Pedobacter westerhofensis]SMO34663.1 ATP-binding cassette, subfamily B [Pedobacter westerhofensis]